MAEALDFSRPNAVPPPVPLVLDPGPHECDAGTMVDQEAFWADLASKPEVERWRAVAGV
ncbi:MAG TPA: hypothetical protein VHN98_09390 [Acidimicrobiales bacterium]|nr:hypothetical protein [Acidimicrobiales bacterium]